MCEKKRKSRGLIVSRQWMMKQERDSNPNFRLARTRFAAFANIRQSVLFNNEARPRTYMTYKYLLFSLTLLAVCNFKYLMHQPVVSLD